MDDAGSNPAEGTLEEECSHSWVSWLDDDCWRWLSCGHMEDAKGQLADW